MTKPPLGKIEKVELRTYWLKEDAEFTPWLARPENLKLLGDAIGKDLEPQGQEVGVGPFRADILCRDQANGDLVLIENQIEQTDHSHLGQILTYVAGLEAKTVVWVAKQFREEHRAALDWLNEVTNDEIEFYGVQVELWRIGDSVAAPRFDVVAHPNEWTREVRESARPGGQRSPAEEQRGEFWKGFGDYLRRTGSGRRPPTVKTDDFKGWGVGGSEFGLIARLHVTEGRVLVYIVLLGPEAKRNFHALLTERPAIDRELADVGLQPTWDEKLERKESQIRVERPCDFSRPETWDPVFRWVTDTLDQFDRVFRPRVRSLPERESEPR